MVIPKARASPCLLMPLLRYGAGPARPLSTSEELAVARALALAVLVALGLRTSIVHICVNHLSSPTCARRSRSEARARVAPNGDYFC